MRTNIVFALLAAFILSIMTPVFAAPAASPAAKPPVKAPAKAPVKAPEKAPAKFKPAAKSVMAEGKITAYDKTKGTIAIDSKGKKMDFVLQAKPMIMGVPKVGAMAKVWYKTDAGKMTATKVEVAKAAPAPAKPAKPAKPAAPPAKK
jgi:hypothetical protein